MAAIRHIPLFLLVIQAAAMAEEQKLTRDEQALLQLYGDQEMVSIATGTKQPIGKAPSVTTVVTAEDIKAMGATDIDEALEAVSGLHVSRNNIGYDPIYTFRGVNSSFNQQVLMLVNGIPITNIYAGDRSVIWGGMPVQAIARIEVVRGPGSALYGADASAGVINEGYYPLRYGSGISEAPIYSALLAVGGGSFGNPSVR